MSDKSTAYKTPTRNSLQKENKNSGTASSLYKKIQRADPIDISLALRKNKGSVITTADQQVE